MFWRMCIPLCSSYLFGVHGPALHCMVGLELVKQQLQRRPPPPANVLLHFVCVQAQNNAEAIRNRLLCVPLQVKDEEQEAAKFDAVFPCILRIIPQMVFNKKDPIIVGVDVEEGIAKVTTSTPTM